MLNAECKELVFHSAFGIFFCLLGNMPTFCASSVLSEDKIYRLGEQNNENSNFNFSRNFINHRTVGVRRRHFKRSKFADFGFQTLCRSGTKERLGDF